MRKTELTLNNEENVIYAISLVKKGAIESDFMLFSDEQRKEYFAKNEDQRIITGAALIPNKEILRKTDDGEYYNVFMSEETIKEGAIRFFKKGYQNNVTLQHSKSVSDNTFFESWIIEDIENDKSNALGFKALVKGTWMVSLKIEDEKLWNDILNSNYFNGFSIEGLFSQKDEKLNKVNIEHMNILEEIKKLLDSNKTEKPKEEEKVNFEDLRLKDGSIIRIDDATLTVSKIEEDGTISQMEDGSYILEDDTILIVKDGKKSMEEVKEEDPKVDPNEFKIVELSSEITKFSELLEIEKNKNVEFSKEIEDLKLKIVELESEPSVERLPIVAEVKNQKPLEFWEVCLQNIKNKK